MISCVLESILNGLTCYIVLIMTCGICFIFYGGDTCSQWLNKVLCCICNLFCARNDKTNDSGLGCFCDIVQGFYQEYRLSYLNRSVQPQRLQSLFPFSVRVLLVRVFPKYQPKTYGHFAWSCLIAPTLFSPCIIFFLLMLGSFILYGFWEPRGRGFSDGILGVLCCCGLSISEYIHYLRKSHSYIANTTFYTPKNRIFLLLLHFNQ